MIVILILIMMVIVIVIVIVIIIVIVMLIGMLDIAKLKFKESLCPSHMFKCIINQFNSM